MVRALAALSLLLGFWASACWGAPQSEVSSTLARPPRPAAPQPDAQNNQQAKDDKPADDDEAKDADEDDDKSADDEAKKKDAEEAPAKKEDAKETDEEKDKDAAKTDSKEAKDQDKAKSDEKPSDKSKDAAETKDSAKKDDKKAAEEKKPETYKVKKKDLKIDVELDGVFVADDMEEVALRPKVWSTFKVEEAVAHGARVHKGDVLVKFDDEDIEKAIAEGGLDERLGELALMQAEEEFPRHEKSIELEYELAKREFDQDTDEYERFQKVMRDLSEKLANYYLKSAEQEFDNAKEELDQLEKMYNADEITEETEEIVLRRQKFQVEMAEFFVKYSKINHDYTVNVSIPRREQALSTAVEQSKLAFDHAKMVKSLGLSHERYELESLRERRSRAVEKQGKLVADRALMTLRAPSDGLAYYGRQIDGRWIEVGSMASKLVPFGAVSPNSVVITIVKDRPMYVQTTVGEKEFPAVKEGQAATVAPLADDDVELAGSVKKLTDVPGSGNKFNVRINLESDDEGPEWLKPGMSCKAKVATYEAKDAIVVPAELVQTDEKNEKKKYVMLQVEDEAKPVRRDVKLGKTKDKEVEVLKGLKAGDEIVKGAKDKADDDDKDAEAKKDDGKKDKSE